jgi:peptidoglycan/LPS O-acetylase OafA/YrhL
MSRVHTNPTLLHNVVSAPPGRSAPRPQPDPPFAKSKSGTGRLTGLDFAKGVLVLVMVLYHWMNYFVGLDSPFYRYLRFLTPSFIFLAGFLISQVYSPRFLAGDARIPGRLVRRGLKLLLLVLFLNGTARVLGIGMAGAHVSDQSLRGLAWAYLTGSTPVAFSVLVPIGYLLILSAGLLVLSRRFYAVFHLVSAALIAAAFVCEWTGRRDGYLEIFSMGLLGSSIGFISIARIHAAVRSWPAILAVYAVYLLAISRWNAIYGLQIVAVCVNLAALYALGLGTNTDRALRRAMMQLGEYSLFAYIAQIVILQILRRGAHAAGSETWVIYGALFACAACTVASVKGLERLKLRAPVVSRLYAALFA